MDGPLLFFSPLCFITIYIATPNLISSRTSSILFHPIFLLLSLAFVHNTIAHLCIYTIHGTFSSRPCILITFTLAFTHVTLVIRPDPFVQAHSDINQNNLSVSITYVLCPPFVHLSIRFQSSPCSPILQDLPSRVSVLIPIKRH